MKVVTRLLKILHGFVGIGAMAGGLGAILNPQSPMGIPVEVLEASPFSDFLIPGIILFAVIGLGNLMTLLLIFLRPRSQGYCGGVMGSSLVIWIIVQCIMLWSVGFLHILFFFIGLMQGVLALFILYRNRQFPLDMVIRIFQGVREKRSELH
ncbi:MAG: hypothetical protein HQ557_17560 [Bacteroidetes bacterium]|nr:hypothetical protein [Bacteroidota bacterium]